MDLSYSSFIVLHHLSGHKRGKVQAALMQGLAEIDRVIKPGGSFIYSDMFQRKTIRDYFTCKGYEIVHRQNFLAVIELVIIRKQARWPQVPLDYRPQARFQQRLGSISNGLMNSEDCKERHLPRHHGLATHVSFAA